jgi:hypothetical protein
MRGPTSLRVYFEGRSVYFRGRSVYFEGHSQQRKLVLGRRRRKEIGRLGSHPGQGPHPMA